MNKMKSNYHTHTYLCRHAEGKPIDYVKIVYEKGYHTIGISDHGPLIDEIYSKIISRRMNFNEYYNLYLPQLQEAKDKYPGIRVLKGLEIEYFPEMDDIYPKLLKDLDYLVLGQHYIHHQNKILSIYDSSVDIDAIISYKNDVIKGIKTGYFKILAHPDLFFWNKFEWNDTLKNIAIEIINASKKYNVYLEINANGIRNCKRKKRYSMTSNNHISYSYPKYEFWELAKSMDAKIIINDDAHFFTNMDDDATKEAIELSNELNINVLDNIDL